MQYNIEIQPAGVNFKSVNILLDDAISQSIPLEHSCKTGDCGVCSADVISGTIQNENGEVVTQGQVLTCQSKALSNATLRVKCYPELVNIKQQTVPCKVASVEYATNDIVILRFRFPPTANFSYLPGQYVDLNCKGVKRSYSIANANANAKAETKELELHIRQVPNGQMSQLLFGKVKENQLMRIEGPKGTFFIRNNDKPLILLATGTGIAPIKAMVEQLIASNDSRQVHIFWGMQFADELYCKVLERLDAENQHIYFSPVLSRDPEWKGHRGYVQDIVCEQFTSLDNFEVYACGSLNMINAAKEKFYNKCLPIDAFHSDAFTPAN